MHRLDQKLEDCRSELVAAEAGLTRLPEHIGELGRRLSGAEDVTQRTLLESEQDPAPVTRTHSGYTSSTPYVWRFDVPGYS